MYNKYIWKYRQFVSAFSILYIYEKHDGQGEESQVDL